MSGDSISQWSQACINADAVVGGPLSHDLGKRISSQDLRDAYATYCKQHSLRPANEEVFGRACKQMFGPRTRLPLGSTGRRPWGYDVPDGDKWQERLDARLGSRTRSAHQADAGTPALVSPCLTTPQQVRRREVVADWAFVSDVSLVSDNLEIMDWRCRDVDGKAEPLVPALASTVGRVNTCRFPASL